MCLVVQIADLARALLAVHAVGNYNSQIGVKFTVILMVRVMVK